MDNIKLGLIPSPDLPAEITSHFIEELPNFLQLTVNDAAWHTQITIDPLVGTAEHIKQVIDKSIQLKEKNEWNYVICLTDLPYFSNKHVVIADLNVEHKVALVSIPAFGSIPMKRRIKRVIAYILNDLQKYNTDILTEQYDKNTLPSGISRQFTCNELEYTEEKSNNNDEKDSYTQEETEGKSHIKYMITSKWLGHLRLLAGMTLANRPWSALISFKKIVMLAFGTGIYITLFPTPWELSTIYSVPRFITLMIIAIISMVTWLIFAHQLWEKPTYRGDVRLRKLYNYTTISTLFIISVFNYIVLYFLFLIAISIFVPAELFEAVNNLEEDASIVYYFQLTWLITSLGTLAGSIGATSEDENKIRQITYSYRQINRSYEIQDEQESDYDYG